ncbi:zinc finger protein 91-like [Achroia grisella]|uniref:zinc finger protein 91-like n=1 Tax=Achroia grisella TaxID=688607 RepID=UPI0027D2EC43|nr:zinc finger protein 91-like [Achroia grisella]
MALKLGKCRLCLKLGDFYSIFTVDNAVQLAEMVMECAQIKVFEGDGLPDKICSECIQKLSSAYIFKQQCERSDQELRRNYVPPPGFSDTPPPTNRQSSDSAFSGHTDNSSQAKPSSSTDGKTPTNRNRKRSHGSIDNVSVTSRTHDRPSSTKRVEELRKSQKRARHQSENTDSDFDYSASQFSAETDSDEPLMKPEYKCDKCDKTFKSIKSRSAHMKIHSGEKPTYLAANAVVNIPRKHLEDASDSDNKLNCEKCGKTFKLKIMLKRHLESCDTSPHQYQLNKFEKSPQKELLVSLEPIDMLQVRRLDCEICTTKFKTLDNLRKHMRVVHAAVLKRDHADSDVEQENGITSVPCLYCHKQFLDYYAHGEHFSKCPQKKEMDSYKCPICHKVLTKTCAYIIHLRSMHFGQPLLNQSMEETSYPEVFECRMCSKKLASQELLITHLATHMSNIEENAAMDNDSRPSTPDGAISVHSSYSNTYAPKGPLNCKLCDKSFKYKKALETHEMKHTTGAIEIKVEPPDKTASTSLLSESRGQLPHADESESESSHDEGEDNTCDICEKQFSYKRLLLQHKRTKHNMSSGTKRAKITLKDCLVRCLICDLEMKVSAINEHNQKHISVNIKPRNMYTCGVPDCGEKFKSCSALANHIKLVHRLKQQPKQSQKLPRLEGGTDLADFCEVVVTKTEPLDTLQSHNGFGEVPINNGGEQASSPLVNMNGFTCTICGKVMATLVSLKRHVNWHTNVGNNIEKSIECFVCKEKFRFQCHYKLHMREHYRDTNLDPKLLTCTICNRKSKHLRAAQAHMNYHKQTRFKNKDYQCSICKRVFQFRKVYLSHMAIHYKRGESVQNTIVGDVTPNNIDRTIFDGTHTCHLCNKVCDSETSLKHHIIWHKSKTSLFGARHECYICQLVFTNKRRLELHIRSHYEDDNGPYKCQICGKGYIDEEYFKRHLKGHNFDHQSHKKRIEKLRKDKVKCPICARYYPDLVKLIRHLRRTHPESKMIKEDPDAPPPMYYSCKLCAKVFLDERRLQHHEEAHLRKPEFFKCKFCGKKTISLKSHRVHIKAHLCEKHLDNPLQCPHCEETFIKGYGLHHHLRDVHGIEETWIAERQEQTLDGPLQEFQCSICFKILASKGNFERHIDYHNSLRCNYCFEYFSTHRFLEGHLSFSCEKKKIIGDCEIYPKKVKCHVCYKAFHLQVKLDCHLRTQHNIKVNKEASLGRKDIVCDYCFRAFENEDALTTHKLYHRTIGYYGCIYCKRKFNTLTVYRKHKNYHYAQLNVDNPTKCEHCDETFVAFREMIYHMRDEHGDNKEWIVLPKESIEEKCPICNKIFYNLHKHLTYHEENRCKKCGEYFYSRVDYDNHLCAIESDDDGVEIVDGTVQPKYEECRFCFKPVTRKNSKRLHNQIHQVSGAISCRFCLLKFKTMEAFNIHAFSHRSRKYNKKPIKCRKCGEKFVKYGLFIRHMKNEHKSLKKMHYRAVVKAERCVVCGEDFPNLHNHYRAHLQNHCLSCNKYFTSMKLFTQHACDKEDSDPSKVFTCDEDLVALINSYVPKDEKDDEKYYGYNDDEEEEEQLEENKSQQVESEPIDEEEHKDVKIFTESQDEESQDERILHDMVQSPIISDVLSLYQKKEDDNDCVVVNLTDDDSVDMDVSVPVITIDDD